MRLAEFIVFLVCIFVHRTTAQDCLRAVSDGGDSLPSFSDPDNMDVIVGANPIQAIVTSYEFHCCGIITGWGAYVQPGGGMHDNGAYSITFQVWRPTSTDRSRYVKVGENIFPSVTLSSSAIQETPGPGEGLHFQPGDVVGYYLDQNAKGHNGGLQPDASFNQETLYYATGNTGLQSECVLEVGSNADLSMSTTLGPIISVSFTMEVDSTADCPSTFTSCSCCPTSTSTFMPIFTSTPIPIVASSTPTPSPSFSSLSPSSSLVMSSQIVASTPSPISSSLSPSSSLVMSSLFEKPTISTMSQSSATLCEAQGCLQASNGSRPLPALTRDGDRFRTQPIQAIITSFRFNCCGVITEWAASVERSGAGGGHNNGFYSITFQVWRPNSPSPVVDGCYNMTGSNYFPDIVLDSDRAVRETPLASKRIHVQPGDVVGFYLTAIENDNNGIPFDDDYTDESVWYATGNIISTGNPTCQFPVGNGRTLSVFTNLAPRITAAVSMSNCPMSTTVEVVPTTSTLAPTPTPTPAPSSTSSTVGVSSSSIVMESPSPTDGQDTTEPPGITDPAVNTNDSSGLIAGFVIALLFVIVIATVAIVIVVFFMRKRQSKEAQLNTGRNSTALSNPSYEETAVLKKFTGKKGKQKAQPLSINVGDSIYETLEGDYQGFPTALDYTYPKPSPTVKYNPKTDEVYTYIPNKAREAGGATSNGPAYHSVGPDVVNHYDMCGEGTGGNSYHTLEPNYKGKLEGSVNSVQYEDPTLPKFRESAQGSSPFESMGIYVPTEAQRESLDTHYEVQEGSSDMQTYNTLQFFVEDQIYWAPADTASGLYQQLASKKYREIPRSQLNLLEQLGAGQFGQVCKGLWTVSNNTLLLAVKTLKPNAPEDDKVKFLQEAAIMGQFSHPNVVKLYGVVTVGEPVMICLEIMSNGDLRSYLRSIDMSSSSARSERDLQLLFLRFAREIAAGMDYLSKKAFVHRDLAARNVLLNEALSCKIGDFGMARDLMDDTYYKSKGGKIPVKWTAPEALLYKKYSTDSDVWSYGMVLFEIWSVGKKPFSMHTNNEVLKLVQNGHCQPPPPGCPREIFKLMVNCWNPEHQYRPKFGSISTNLQRPTSKLLYWSPLDDKLSQQVSVLGAPLEEAYKLHEDMQETYKQYESV